MAEKANSDSATPAGVARFDVEHLAFAKLFNAGKISRQRLFEELPKEFNKVLICARKMDTTTSKRSSRPRERARSRK